MSVELTSENFIKDLLPLKTDRELGKLEKFFKGGDGVTKAFGVTFGNVFKLAKKYEFMTIPEIHKLLDSEYYEIRMGAVSIMGYQARSQKTSGQTRKELYELYLKRHDRINNWDLVDRASYDVVGGYLINKPRGVLYNLAKSEDIWERRTAIVSTYAFIKVNDLKDTFKIAEILIRDKEELINKAVGSWLREAGKKDEDQLINFLERHAAAMPRVTLRYAVEKLEQTKRKYFMGLGKIRK